MESIAYFAVLELLTNIQKQLLAEGRSNGAIATAMFLSNGTVEKHITTVFNKLGLETSPSSHRRVLAVLRYLST